MLTPDQLLAWHFVRADCTLDYGDGRIVVVGETLSFDGEPKCCERGMHGSVSAYDALKYAPGPILCRVELSGAMDKESDKIAAQHRKVLAMVDATETLRAFAPWCALEVAHLWDMPDVVRRYLETGDEHIRYAAAAAAEAAAETAEAEAAANAAKAAYVTAVYGIAAWAAASANAANADNAARAAQRTHFESMCLALIGDANVDA